MQSPLLMKAGKGMCLPERSEGSRNLKTEILRPDLWLRLQHPERNEGHHPVGVGLRMTERSLSFKGRDRAGLVIEE